MRYRPHRDADERMRSAVTLVKGLLQLAPQLTQSHAREFVRLALWKISEAETSNKYENRFQSLEAKKIFDGRGLEHEHVYQRAELATRLLANPSQIEQFLKMAVGCTVTSEEHKRLSEYKNLFGWARYRAAIIRVWDMKEDKEFVFPEAPSG